jgi:ABC-2 type transport system permease protein
VTGLLAVCRNELRRVFVLKPAFSVLIAAALIYAVLYPQPYLNEALRKIPIAVVDSDGTVASREVSRLIDATSDVSVAMVLPDLPSAEREVFVRGIYGILVIPKNFERDLLHDRSSPLALYADASYFLIYQRISGAVSGVARTFGTEVETERLIAAGVDPAIAVAAADPMPLTAVPLFNPQGGYATYLLPAAFVLLVQQMLLIGTGLLGTLKGGDNENTAIVTAAGPAATVLGKALAYLMIEAIILPFYLIVLPYLYGIPRLGSVGTMLLFAIPFVLAVSGLGLVVAAIFRKPLSVQLASAALGLPFFFLAGFSWPSEAMPHAIRLLAQLVPSTSAIDGMVRIAQLGAPLSDVRSEFLTLWGLTVCYGAGAVMLEIRKQRLLKTAP